MVTLLCSVMSVRDLTVQIRSSKWRNLFSSHDSKVLWDILLLSTQLQLSV